MADVVHTTGAHSCVQNSRSPDPVALLLEVMEHQLSGWRTLPPDDDALRDKVAELTRDQTGALLRRVEPTTMMGAIRALRHVVEKLAPNNGPGPDDYSIPLARNAITALERMVGT